MLHFYLTDYMNSAITQHNLQAAVNAAVATASVSLYNACVKMSNANARHLSASLTPLKAEGPRGHLGTWVYFQLNSADTINAPAPLGDLPLPPTYNIAFPSIFLEGKEELTAVRTLGRY